MFFYIKIFNLLFKAVRETHFYFSPEIIQIMQILD